VSDRIRLNITITTAVRDRLEELVERTHAETKAEVVRRALAFYDEATAAEQVVLDGERIRLVEEEARIKAEDPDKWLDEAERLNALVETNLRGHEQALRERDEARALLRESVNLMDGRGRKNPEGNSYMLWESEWDGMRSRFVAALREEDSR